jgi:hypothetical protein
LAEVGRQAGQSLEQWATIQLRLQAVASARQAAGLAREYGSAHEASR